MIRRVPPLVAALAVLGASSALAHHRQTPPVVALTTSGDVTLPRLPAAARSTVVVALPGPGGTWIATVQPYRTPVQTTTLAETGDNQNPAVSVSGRLVAYDTDADPTGSGLPGRQVVVAQSGTLRAGPIDPTGTSGNPALDANGARLAFESTGDLANTGNAGARQIFLAQQTGVSQLSGGMGTSRNPALAPRRGWVAFESTSAPGTGIDTGIEQIWLGTVFGGAPTPMTSGLAPSTRPTFSDDGAILAFQSRADLGGDQADMGVPQVFIHDLKSRTTARLTFDPAGCTDPGVAKVLHDWRVGFVCGGQAYFYLVRQDALYRIDMPGGDTTRLVPELGKHFVVVATTANLVAGTGTTSGHRVYLLNLFKRPATAVVTAPPAVWFPSRGIKPLK